MTQTRAKRKVVPISHRPDYLIVLLVDKDGAFDEVYNGPGIKVWDLVKDKPKPANGQYQVTPNKLAQGWSAYRNKLRELDDEIREEDRV